MSILIFFFFFTNSLKNEKEWVLMQQYKTLEGSNAFFIFNKRVKREC
jgi:hypothetical protein